MISRSRDDLKGSCYDNFKRLRNNAGKRLSDDNDEISLIII